MQLSKCETHDVFLQPLFNLQVLVSVRAAALNPIDYKKPSIPVISWGLGGKPAAQVRHFQCEECGGVEGVVGVEGGWICLTGGVCWAVSPPCMPVGLFRRRDPG